ncbi:MAG: VWA domain-containing protein [Nanoarchaeota archaeon]|nr:VWA domain-containing protein [Nanoarchaeota archaeon]
MELTYLQPNYLWLLCIVPFLILTHFYGLKYSHKKALKFANFEALARVTGGSKLSLNLPLLFLRFSTLFFLIFALSGPILWYEGQGSNANFLIAIDNSGSMLGNDFQPNRMEAAKSAATQLVNNVPEDATVGLMTFAGTPLVKQTLTADREIVRQKIAELKIDFSSGTAVGDGIIAGTNLLLQRPEGRVLVLLTDGQSNVGTLLPQAINYANEYKVTVHTIGVATPEGGSFTGVGTLSKLDEDGMKLIAANTGGKFYKAQTNEQLAMAYRDIAFTSTRKLPVQLAFWLIMLCFTTLSIEWVFVNTKFRSIP